MLRNYRLKIVILSMLCILYEGGDYLSLKKCKVYNDGSHFVAIRHTEGKKGARLPRPPEEAIIIEESTVNATNLTESIKNGEILEEIKVNCDKESKELKENNISSEELLPEMQQNIVKSRVSTRSEEFMYWYRQSFGMKREKQREFIASKLRPYFKDEESLFRFVEWKLQLRERADITRRIRCKRRADLHEFNYFCTFTYDSQKMDEKEFERKLLNTLRHFASRKNWKYMGTWERGHENDRLHFHAIMYIPPDKMSGEIITKREFDLKEKRMKDRTLNTFFEERFGRNTFQIIDGAALSVNTALGYVLKYIEKDGGRVICSRGLRTFIETDIDDDDIITRLHEDDDTKYILFDDFTVYKDGKELGEFSPGVLANAKTVN